MDIDRYRWIQMEIGQKIETYRIIQIDIARQRQIQRDKDLDIGRQIWSAGTQTSCDILGIVLIRGCCLLAVREKSSSLFVNTYFRLGDDSVQWPYFEYQLRSFSASGPTSRNANPPVASWFINPVQYRQIPNKHIESFTIINSLTHINPSQSRYKPSYLTMVHHLAPLSTRLAASGAVFVSGSSPCKDRKTRCKCSLS